MIFLFLGQPSDPNESLAAVSDLTEAYRTLPAPIFKEWLDFRRRAAATFLPPMNKATCTKHRVMMLDAVARLGARLN